MKPLKGVCIGAGYFSHFQYEAWKRIPEVEITAFSNRNEERSQVIRDEFGIERCYTDWREMLETEKPDFVDIITPPPTHLEICKVAAELGIDIICQKPLAPTLEESRAVVEATRGVRFMVHENFRFQPWHREIKRQIAAGAIGQLFSINMRSRMGDGWGENAYIPRQPYFRDYPQLLIFETGVHFIDTFRFLAGEVSHANAWLRRLNPIIKGEDCGLMILEHDNGCLAQWDANRYNEPPEGVDARYTFGEMLVEGSEGSLRLALDGTITLQRLGEASQEVSYVHERRGFAGDCVYHCQRHFIDRLIDGQEFETSGDEYLKTLAVQEEVYANADKRGSKPKKASSTVPGFQGLDHLAIAVPSTQDALALWQDTFGFKVVCSEVVNDGTVRLTHLDLGNTHLQLVEPVTTDHPLQQWLADHGPGLHHFCFRVDNIDESMSGSPVATAPNPHEGTEGKRALFLDKEATQTLLVEFTGA